MADVSFEKAKVPLPLSCIALMQNMPPAEQAELNEDVSKLDATDKVSEEVKSYLLGVALLNYVGDEVLQAAVKLLDDQIQVSKEERNLDTSLPSE
jgi:predicted solute-binding protein